MKTLSRKISNLNASFGLHLDRPDMSEEEHRRYREKAERIIQKHAQAAKRRRKQAHWIILRDGVRWNTGEETLGAARAYVRRMRAEDGTSVKWQILDAEGVEHTT